LRNGKVDRRMKSDFILRTDRRKILQKEVEEFVDRIKKAYVPDKIILFGSVATGKAKENSDIDIIIIKETEKKFWERLREISKYCSREIGMDVLVYTPEEFEKLSQDREFFKQEVLMKGKIIYERE
jgi:predicted nucleotidyltransferase